MTSANAPWTRSSGSCRRLKNRDRTQHQDHPRAGQGHRGCSQGTIHSICGFGEYPGRRPDWPTFDPLWSKSGFFG